MCIREKPPTTSHYDQKDPSTKLTARDRLEAINTIIASLKNDEIVHNTIPTSINHVMEHIKTQNRNMLGALNGKSIHRFDPGLLGKITLFLAQYGIDVADLYQKVMSQNDARVSNIVANEHGQLVNSIYAYFTHFVFQDIEAIKQLYKQITLPSVTIAQDVSENLKISFLSLLEAYLEIIQYYSIDSINLIETYIKLKIAYARCLAITEN